MPSAVGSWLMPIFSADLVVWERLLVHESLQRLSTVSTLKRVGSLVANARVVRLSTNNVL
jgi:hypothetical protein